MEKNTTPFHPFIPDADSSELPRLFTCPFHYEPHPLSVRAAEEVRRYLTLRTDWKTELDKGKMFGVLVVQKEGRTGFLAAYSGILCGRNDHDFFVPPVFDLLQPDGFFKTEEAQISRINHRIEALEHSDLRASLLQQAADRKAAGEQVLKEARNALKEAKRQRDLLRASDHNDFTEEQLTRESRFLKAEYKRLEKQWKAKLEEVETALKRSDEEIEALKTERKRRSVLLQNRLFAQFRMLNARGEEKDLWQIFREHGRPVPPSGAGECAAPKLLQYAYRHGYRPLAMAEFWWGASPEAEIRKHGYYYPACKSKCEPILGHMLQGLDVEPNAHEDSKHLDHEPELVYEDEWMAAVNKPAGMLSVPGKGDAPSVWSWARAHFPEATGPLLVHRLDMDTSGVLLIAKDPETHRKLQQLFETRHIKKRYIALLDGTVTDDEGFIRLPLCPNPNDRPRQMVSTVYGKAAVTRFEVLSRSHGQTRVAFYPFTGRTHQLRVHAAHPEGLDTPIVGDNLYGRRASRLFLHAETVTFRHFKTGRWVSITAPAPF